MFPSSPVVSCVEDTENRQAKVKSHQKTIPTVNRLLSDIAKVRLRGFGENDEENDDGVSALGVPIKNTKGEFEAAVNVVFPAGTISWKEKLDLVKKLQSAAEEIEKFGGVLNAKLDILP